MSNYYVIKNGELYHYGVLGMRWGIRRYQNRDGTLTPLGKRHLSERGVRTEENLVEKTIPKGTAMYRTTAKSADEYGEGSIYVTYKDADRNFYKEGSMVKSYVGGKREDSVYEHQFELKTDIKVPSLKTMREVEKQVISKNVKLQAEVGKAWMESILMSCGQLDYKGVSIASTIAAKLRDAKTEAQRKNIYQDARKKHGDWWGDYYYHNARSIVDAQGRVQDWLHDNNTLAIEQSLGRAANTKAAVVKALKKLGYNAMYDNAGIGVGSDGKYTKNQEGVEPLIIFDSSATLNKVSTKEVTVAEQKRAGDTYTKWKKERDKTLKGFN